MKNIKKYILFSVIAIFSLNSSHSLAIQDITIIAIGIGGYIARKIATKYREYTLPDAPADFQKWARPILKNHGLSNADTIPLKSGEGWCCVGDSFIEVPKDEAIVIGHMSSISKPSFEHSAGEFKFLYTHQLQSKDTLDLSECILLHEVYHYKGKAFLKGYITTYGITQYGIGMPLSKANFLSNFPVILVPTCSFLVSQFNHNIYSRYEEKNADENAFMHASLDSVIAGKAFFEQEVKKDVAYWNENILYKNATPTQQRMFLETINSIFGNHPTNKSRAEHAQRCLDQRCLNMRAPTIKPINLEYLNKARIITE